MRILHATAQAALASGRFGLRAALKAELDDGDFAVWDDVGTIAIDGTSYSGAPGRFTVAPVASISDLSARPVDVTLSGLDADVVALIDQTNWHQRPVTIHRLIFAIDAPQTFYPLPYFAGYLDQMIWREQVGGQSMITFRCEASARDLARRGARTRSDTDQRQRDPTDRFFEHVVVATTTSIQWGRRVVAPQQPPPPRKLFGIF